MPQDTRVISLSLPEELLEPTGRFADALGIPRAEYIRRAIAEMNRRNEAELRASRLVQSSHRVRAESMNVLEEFRDADEDPDA
jgi:metal-responsive CopG/Arc/MetJ family transcriptional regulator